MLKFDRKKKKLVIPVGINPSYNIDSNELYNTTDANVVSGDIISGKVAYGSDGKIIGSLDIEERVQESYNEGVQSQKSKLESITITENGTYSREDGYNNVVVNVPDLNGSYDEGYSDGIATQKSKLESITITENGTYSREDGYNEVIVDVPDLNGNYDEGYNEGVAIGRNEIIEEQSDATITPQTVFKGEIGYGSNNERIVGEFEFAEGFDFSVIGYSQADSNECNNTINEDIAYSKTLYDAWDPNKTNASFQYKDDLKLKFAPKINTSNVTLMNAMFSGCNILLSVPLLDTSKVTDMTGLLSGCYYLKSIPHFDTKNVTIMSQTFNYCESLTSVPLLNTSKVTTMNAMFSGCQELTSVPLFNTSNVTDMYNLFYYCKKLTSVPLFDTSKVTNMSGMFQVCNGLTSVPLFNTSNVTDMKNMFSDCITLENVPQFNTSNVTSMRNMFFNCKKLTTIPELYAGKVNEIAYFCEYYGNILPLTNFGGLVDLGKGFNKSSYSNERVLELSYCNNLTYESAMNVINKVYDMNLTDVTDATIKFHKNTKALLSNEDIAIATSKGWTIS